MSSMNHPDTEQLTAYLADPAAEDYRRLRMHLMTCGDCRALAGLLANLRENLHEIETEQYQQMISQNNELGEMLHARLIEKYVDGSLHESDQQRVSDMLRKDGQAMKAAMHYAGHSAGMQRTLGVTPAEHPESIRPLKPVAKPGLLTMLRQWLVVRMPVWMTVPVSAALAGVLTVALTPSITPETEKYSIVAYQDNPVIRFKGAQDLPGIGFFSSANKTAKPYGRIGAAISGDRTIRLSWPAVDGALSYTMHLKMFDMGRQVSVGKVTTSSTEAGFERLANDAGRRYVWSLSGRTRTGELFSTKGGFVIHSVNE